ncbi:MAG TPA: hypothetical protein VI670_19760 [Thermoanaerobaculia bacterium]
MRTRWQCALAVAVLALSGCQSTSTIQYRATKPPAPAMTVEDLEARNPVDDGNGAKTCSELVLRDRSVEKFRAPNGEEFTIGVIELSDDGTLKSQQQHDAVFDEMKRVARAGEGAVIVSFVHGWHHRAKVCDENLSCFRRTMQGLVMRKGDRTNPGPVFGLYIGWRGESLRGQAGTLTFYNRKSTAQHVGSLGGKELLLELNKVQHELDTEVRQATGGKRWVNLVTVGHSFGGAFVYSAFEALKAAEVASPASAACNGVKPVREGIGDLVVLVNPAFEARRYRYFADDLAKPGRYSPEQRRVLLTVASEADQAVGQAFPAGRSLWLAWHPWAWGHGSAEIRGLGHYTPYTTHRLDFKGAAETPVPPAALTNQEKIDACDLRQEIENDLVRAECTCSYPVYKEGIETMRPTSLAKLEPMPGTNPDPHAPFIVVSAPGTLISGHNDIYNPNFIVFLIKTINENLQGPGMPKPAGAMSPCKTAALR